MLWSHYILFYFWYCYETADGKMVIPWSVEDLSMHLVNFKELLLTKGIPSALTWLVYFSFFVIQLVLAAVMPGMTMYGLPTENGHRLVYHCNGYLCYYFCMFGVLFANFTGIFRASHIVDNFGEYLLASMVIGDLTSLYWYLYGLYTAPPGDSRSGNHIYDFFMGSVLYPRIGEVDIKMIAEARWSWLTLMILTTSAAFKQYESTGSVSKEMALMVLAHWLYSNATVKGEHYIPGTWDMFHEKFGWMLNFWNITGVPFLYCFQSLYVLRNQAAITAQTSLPFTAALYLALLIGYYIFDTANCQKASYKLPGVKRSTFPQLPWAVLPTPARCIETPRGRLLADGWYRYARKMQYTGDIIMATVWGLACGWDSPLPYFYVCFFTSMITHRQWRDEIRCREKYGTHWDDYTGEVPNVFVPSMQFFKDLLSGRIGAAGSENKKSN